MLERHIGYRSPKSVINLNWIYQRNRVLIVIKDLLFSSIRLPPVCLLREYYRQGLMHCWTKYWY